MWRHPAILAPLRGFWAPYFCLRYMSPGISFSARVSSLRPQSAREMSAAGKEIHVTCCHGHGDGHRDAAALTNFVGGLAHLGAEVVVVVNGVMDLSGNEGWRMSAFGLGGGGGTTAGGADAGVGVVDGGGGVGAHVSEVARLLRKKAGCCSMYVWPGRGEREKREEMFPFGERVGKEGERREGSHFYTHTTQRKSHLFCCRPAPPSKFELRGGARYRDRLTVDGHIVKGVRSKFSELGSSSDISSVAEKSVVVETREVTRVSRCLSPPPWRKWRSEFCRQPHSFTLQCNVPHVVSPHSGRSES